jgi:phosphoribosyl 1,2-cyclic phosphate phosphodiesterase
LTDTNHIPARTIAGLDDLDVLVLDALHQKKHHSHFNLSESIEVAQRIAAERTFLIHISHRMGLHKAVDEGCPVNIHLGYDGLTIY